MADYKLTIKAYDEPDGTQQGDTFEASINPGSIKQHKSIRFNQTDYPHGKIPQNQFQGMGDDTLAFELVIDGTGIASDTKNVDEEINRLQKLVYDYQADNHRPYFLEVQWSKQHFFQGYLQSMDIEYSLFKTDGSALRAKLALSFIGYIDPGKFEKDPGSHSPDMTHIRTVTASDTLFSLCREIYGDPKYSIQVARKNNLMNFRKLTPGTNLHFPPLRNK